MKGKPGGFTPPPPEDFFAQPNAKPKLGDKSTDQKQTPSEDELAVVPEASKTTEDDDFRKPAAVKSSDTQTEDEEKKLARLKKKVAKKNKAQEKKQKNEEKKKASKNKDPSKRKKKVTESVKEKPKKTGGWTAVKNTFQKFGGMFTDKAEKNAEAKINGGKSVKNLEDGDDVMPASNPKKAQEDRGEHDVWIDDPSLLTNKKHRTDLMLVTANNDNNGQLFHEKKRPFWKNKAFLKEIPPPPAEKAVSKLMMQVVRDEIPLADPVLEPEMDYTDNLEDLMAKDTKWFKEENVLGNTIRSAVVSLDTQSMFPRGTPENMKPLETQEPSVMKLYVRMQPETPLKDEPFKKAPPPGKPRRLRGKGSNSKSSTDSEK